MHSSRLYEYYVRGIGTGHKILQSVRLHTYAGIRGHIKMPLLIVELCTTRGFREKEVNRLVTYYSNRLFDGLSLRFFGSGFALCYVRAG